MARIRHSERLRAGDPRRTSGSRRADVAVLLALAVIVLVGAGVLGVLRHHQQQVATWREDAATAAAVAAHDFASYDYRRFDADLARATAHTTGQFTQRYRTTNAALAASYRRQQLVTTASVLRAGVSTMSQRSATVLVFLDQMARAAGTAQPVRAYRLVLHLRASHAHWLVSDVDVL